MASAARPLARAAARVSARNAFSVAAPRMVFRQGARRAYSSEPTKASAGGSSMLWLAGIAVVGAGAGYWYTQQSASPKVFTPTQADYQKVYNEIASRLEEDSDYDDGSYAPILFRLSWHCSGTYDKVSGTGGSNGATMRFAPESGHGANAGLNHARDFLEPVKAKFPWITYSDLWILGGVCAVQEMMGPKLPYRPGRTDKDASGCTPNGRLPDGAKTQDHLRDIFYRMGFDDREIVALSGGHAVGRCHSTRSGFEGPWTFSPTVVTNDYFKLLLDSKWEFKKWNGPKQYEDKESRSLMMLPADLAIIQDKKFRVWVEKYAQDNDLFFKDFASVVVKLFENGVPFAEGTKPWIMKTTREQE